MQRFDTQTLATQKDISDWRQPPSGGMSCVAITAFYSQKEFSEFLIKLSACYSHLPVRHRPHLSFPKYAPTKEGFTELIELAEKLKERLPFSELTLKIDDVSLLNHHSSKYNIIFKLIEALNLTPIRRVHFIIPNAQVMSIFLNKELGQKINYPMTMEMRHADQEGQVEKLYFDFWKKLIPQIQIYNVSKDASYLKKRSQEVEEEKKDNEEFVVNDLNAPKIKLKELITRHLHGKANDPVYDQLIDVEEQLVEQKEVAIAEQEEFVREEIVVAEEVEEEQQQQEERYTFGLPLVDAREFRVQYVDVLNTERGMQDSRVLSSYHKEDVNGELFSHWRGGISCLSPDAAVVVAKHLSVFISLNLDNLPPHFLIKERQYDPRFQVKNSPHIRGESVLDYDPRAEPRKTNAYTPKEALKHDNRTNPVYSIDIKTQISESLSNNSKYFSFIQENETHFINMWIYHGERGVEEFCKQLGLFETDDRHSIKKCLLDNYLKHFPHWDHFLDDSSFFDCLTKIHDYSSPQRKCLQRFLTKTGESHHDLSDTLIGFDKFWEEWALLCRTNNVNISRIGDANWHTRYGHPVVYMERLITILKNARDLEEQIECLEGITLNSYGLYCDSRYRNFKIVSYEMQDESSNIIRSPLNSSADRVLRDFNAENTVRDCYRKIGQKVKSIPIKTLVKFYESYEGLNRYSRLPTPHGVLETALFFIQHERWLGEDILPELFKAIFEYKEKKYALRDFDFSMDHSLQKLFDQGCRLTPAEGILICNKIQKDCQYLGPGRLPSDMGKFSKKIEEELFKPLQDATTRVKNLKRLLSEAFFIPEKVKAYLVWQWSEASLEEEAQSRAQQLEQIEQAVRAQLYFRKNQKN
jgi:hypothetical protein